MKAKIIRIGNSQGIRIPKPVLEQVGLGEDVELEVRDDEIAIRPLKETRAGWAASFYKMAAAGDDALLDGDVVSSEWDEAGWTW